jgi:hypothetical protein
MRTPLSAMSMQVSMLAQCLLWVKADIAASVICSFIPKAEIARVEAFDH